MHTFHECGQERQSTKDAWQILHQKTLPRCKVCIFPGYTRSYVLQARGGRCSGGWSLSLRTAAVPGELLGLIAQCFNAPGCLESHPASRAAELRFATCRIGCWMMMCGQCVPCCQDITVDWKQTLSLDQHQHIEAEKKHRGHFVEIGAERSDRFRSDGIHSFPGSWSFWGALRFHRIGFDGRV